MTTPAPTQNGHLVSSLAEKSTAIAASTYSNLRERLPQSVKPRVEQVEQTVASAAGPYVAKAQDSSATLLRAADERVDAALTSAARVYQNNSAYLSQQLAKQKEFHAANLETYRQAREAYLKKVEDAVEFLKEKGLAGTARAAADEVLARVGEARSAVAHAPAAVLHKVQDALDRLLAFGPVNAAVQAAKPTFDAALGQYVKVHDSVVASQQYRQVYDLANDLAARAQQTWLFAKAKENLLPLARPAVDTVLASPTFNTLVQHLQPIEAGRA